MITRQYDCFEFCLQDILHIKVLLFFPAEDGTIAAGGIGTSKVHRIGAARGGALADVAMGAHGHKHKLTVEIILPHEDFSLRLVIGQTHITSDTIAGTEDVAPVFALEDDLTLTFVDNAEAGL